MPIGLWGGAVARRYAMRHGSSATGVVDVRGLGRREPQFFAVARLRVSIGPGFVWGRGPIELEWSAVFVAEPWWVCRGASRLKQMLRENPGPTTPLLGAALRFSPGLAVGRV